MSIISGLNNEAGKVIVINESDWSVEANEDVTAQPDTGYEITGLAAGQKLVVFRQESGEIEAFGNITAEALPEAVDGLRKSSDSSPLTSVLDTGISDLVDGGRFTQVSVATSWDLNFSWGVDLSTPGTINGLDVWCETTRDDVLLDQWFGASNDSCALYYSNDNANWTFIEQIDSPAIIYAEIGYFAFRCPFSSSQTGRYFKVKNAEVSQLYVKGGGSGGLRIAEIELIL